MCRAKHQKDARNTAFLRNTDFNENGLQRFSVKRWKLLN